MNFMADGQEYKSDSRDKLLSEASVEESGSRVLVLVVDDDVRILSFIRPSLRLAGYDVITATSGEEALNLVNSKKPSIMLLDIVMSPMDGFEVLKRLRTFSELLVIAISAHASTAEKAFSLGANDFVSKPFRPDELVKKIKALLKHAGNESNASP
jgi:DNA-binding response OmpR family regulator